MTWLAVIQGFPRGRGASDTRVNLAERAHGINGRRLSGRPSGRRFPGHPPFGIIVGAKENSCPLPR